MTEDELILRKWLWLKHGCLSLYGDDGEMQCAECRLDFKRDSVQRINQVFEEKTHQEAINFFNKSQR